MHRRHCPGGARGPAHRSRGGPRGIPGVRRHPPPCRPAVGSGTRRTMSVPRWKLGDRTTIAGASRAGSLCSC